MYTSLLNTSGNAPRLPLIFGATTSLGKIEKIKYFQSVSIKAMESLERMKANLFINFEKESINESSLGFGVGGMKRSNNDF